MYMKIYFKIILTHFYSNIISKFFRFFVLFQFFLLLKNTIYSFKRGDVKPERVVGSRNSSDIFLVELVFLTQWRTVPPLFNTVKV